MQDQEVDIVSHEMVTQQEANVDPITGETVMHDIVNHNVKVRKTVRNGTVRVENIPPERIYHL